MKKVFFALTIAAAFLFCGVLGAADDNPAKDLQTGLRVKDNKMIKKAVEKLVLQNDEKAFNTLSAGLSSLGAEPDQEAYISILTGIARLTDKDVIPKTTDLILRNKSNDLGRDLLAVMKVTRSPVIVPLLGAVLEKGALEMQLECLHQLGAIYAKDAIEAIINFIRPVKSDDKNKKDIIKAAIDALKNVTGLDKGNYHESWVQWWDENKDKDAGEIIRPKGVYAGNIEHVGQYRDMKGVETLPAEKVIVIRNDYCDKHFQGDRNFDKIQSVLKKLDVPHTVVGKSEINDDSYSLDDKWAVVFNCNMFSKVCCGKDCRGGGQATGIRTQNCVGAGDHMAHDTQLSDKTIKKLYQFVETGGYLFTEDLNIKEILIRKPFAGMIADTKTYPDQTVKIIPAPGALLHPYLKYVFEAPPSINDSDEGIRGETRSVKPGDFRTDAEWKIDNDSPDIKVLKKDAVTVLIVSPKLRKTKQDKVENEGAVAVTWGYSPQGVVITGNKAQGYQGGGRVLHVMSHFGKQRSKLDEFALQNLILNFLMELNERRPKAPRTTKR